MDVDLIIQETENLEVLKSILGQCYRKATESPDLSTQIGSVLITQDYKVLGPTFSCNNFCNGWVPSKEDFERPRKYLVTEHSERGCLYKAAKLGIATNGLIMVSTWAACSDCARAIVGCGISKLVRHFPPYDIAVERWLDSVSIGDEVMQAGGVEIIDVHGPILESFPILRGGELFDPAQLEMR